MNKIYPPRYLNYHYHLRHTDCFSGPTLDHFCKFSFFSTNLLKNCRFRRDSNLDCQSRRRVFDHRGGPILFIYKGKSIVCKGVLSHILIGHLKLLLNWAWKNIQLTTDWTRHTGRSGPVRQSLTTCNHSNSSSSAAARPHPRNSYKLAWLGSELIQRRGISPGNHWQLFGRGDGLTVSVLAFSSDDLSSNPAEVYSFSFVKLFVNEQKEAGHGHFWIWWLPR